MLYTAVCHGLDVLAIPTRAAFEEKLDQMLQASAEWLVTRYQWTSLLQWSY